MEGGLSYFLNKAKLLIVVLFIVFLGTNTSHSTNSYAKTNKIAYRYLADDNRDLSNKIDKNSLVTNALTLLAYTNVFIDDNIKESKSIEHQFKEVNSSIFHLFSHGKPGELFINNQWLHVQEIAVWLKANGKLQDKKQLNIYGCEFAKGQKGQAAVAYLEKELKITVAASTNITGKDGDWVLETVNQDYAKSFSKYQYNLQLTGPTDDFDGDGIQNQNDLDDDNDGILDSDEQNCTVISVSKTGVTATASSSVIGAGFPSELVNNGNGNTFYYKNNAAIAGTEVAKFQFPSATLLHVIEVGTNKTAAFLKANAVVSIQGSNDGSSWTTLKTQTMTGTANSSTLHPGNNGERFEFVDNITPYVYYRILGVSGSLSNGPYVQEAYFIQNSCTDINTDGDALANRFDTDSDNDSCSDANEAGVTRNLTPNYTFPTANVGSNGFYNDLETAPDSNEYVGAYTYSAVIDGISNCYVPNCTDSNKIGRDCDYDGDGLLNQYDVDDDNDGILDQDECPTTTLVANGHLNSGQSPWEGEVNFDNRTNSPFRDGLYYNFINIDDNPNGGSIQSYSDIATDGAYQVFQEDLQTGINYLYTFDLGIWTDFVSNTNTSEYSVELRDANGAELSPPIIIETGNFYTDIKNHPSAKPGVGSINTTFRSFEGSFSVPAAGSYSIFFKSAGSGSFAADYFIDRVAVDGAECTLNNDTDSLTNKYDLDSDNDNCADYIEGGGSFTASDGSTAGGSASGGTGSSITTNLCADASCVDNNGLPINTGTPQSVGSSQDENVQDANCPIIIDAINDDFTSTPISGAIGGVVGDVTTNDTLDGVIVTDTDITIAIDNNGGVTGLSIDANGNLTVPSNTIPGNYTITYTICEMANSTNCDTASVIIIVFEDTDGDGVSNTDDLDNDNDGILDADEGYSCQGNSPFAPVNPPVINDGVTALSDLYDGINGIGAKFNAVNDRLVLDLGQVVTAGTVIKIETNANSNGANNTTLNISQSDNTGGSLSNPVDISPTSTTSINTDYILDAATQYITLTMTVRTSGRMEVDYVEVQEICSQLDTDMDGIPNHLDLDSDNDNCPDFIEGAGTFMTSDGETAGGTVSGGTGSTVTTNLCADNTCVNANGVPTITGSPQGTHPAVTDSAINFCLAFPDLSLIKTVSNAIPKVGDTIIYTLTVKNDGLANATGVKVTDVLPLGVTYVSHNSTPSGDSYTGNVWDVGTVNIGSSKTLQITVTVNGAGSITNTAEISNSSPSDSDSSPNNN